ncbi:MAG: right-handed parallel beta-helix repeat-containing protein [Mycolicibacterium sp.]|nr:right-handed parallel beta-helix repeat-containing protein [Mycolicibacterium sp.]
MTMKSSVAGMSALLLFALPAYAQEVYPECRVPPATPNNVWYIDPVNGQTPAAGGDGSQAHPWNSLLAVVSPTVQPGYTQPLLSNIPYSHRDASGTFVFTANPSAPIHPGDEILLMSGNYGVIEIGIYNYVISNPYFVTVAAAPGQTPVIARLQMMSTDHWMFSGIKFQSLASSTDQANLVEVGVQDNGLYPASNIIFENILVSSQDDVSGWTQAQWVANGRNGISLDGGPNGAYMTCVSITGSRITNVRTGFSASSDRTLFSGNEIDHFGDDGIDYAASDLIITNNYIHDNFNIGDGSHEDAMQGSIGRLSPGQTVNYFQNILIDSNTIVRQTDPNLPWPYYLNGIDAFDMDWTYVTVSNNVIVTSACTGIVYSSIHNSWIINNTVIDDGLYQTAGDCKPIIGVNDNTWESPNSSNETRVRNNLASAIAIDNRLSGVEADHNVLVPVNGIGGPLLVEYVDGVAEYYGKPGTYPTANIIDPSGTASEFVNFDPSTLTYNVMLTSGAAAIGAADPEGMPAVDILGVSRTDPYDAGAYSYPQ